LPGILQAELVDNTRWRIEDRLPVDERKAFDPAVANFLEQPDELASD
jgi:hypothetical protein